MIMIAVASNYKFNIGKKLKPMKRNKNGYQRNIKKYLFALKAFSIIFLMILLSRAHS